MFFDLPVFLLVAALSGSCFSEGEDTTVDIDTEKLALISYQKLFKEKRAMQLDAVKKVIKIPDIQKQERTLLTLCDTIAKVIIKARSSLQFSGFIPGMAFPSTDANLREAISNVLENVVLFAEFALRLPDIISYAYSNKNDLKNAIDWAISFSNETGFYDESSTELINLAAQELSLIDRSPDFVNPYRKSSSRREKSPEQMERDAEAASKKAVEERKRREKEGKKAKKGPRLSGVRRKSEL